MRAGAADRRGSHTVHRNNIVHHDHSTAHTRPPAPSTPALSSRAPPYTVYPLTLVSLPLLLRPPLLRAAEEASWPSHVVAGFRWPNGIAH